MTIEVKVKPRSANEEVKKLEDGKFEVRVNDAPESGKANKRVVELIAEYFNVPKSYVTIKHGLTSKNKVILIEGL